MDKIARETLASFLIAMGLLAMFNSSSLVTWAYDQEERFLPEGAGAFAETWHEWMEAAGFAQVTETIRAQFSELSNAL